MESKTEIQQSFRVVLVGGKISDMISAHDTREAADARALVANAKAEALKIDARYEVREQESVKEE